MAKDAFQEFDPADRTWTDHPLFHGVSPQTLSAIGGQIKMRRYTQGMTIFSEGDPATHLFIVRSGSVQIVREQDGRTLVIDTLGRGEIFGEMGLLTDNKRNAAVIASAPLEVLAISRAAFDELISQNFAIAKQLVQIHNARSLALERALATGVGTSTPVATRQPDHERIVSAVEHQVFTIFSPAGGTGKTMLACNLGVLLARKMPRQVVLVDLSMMASQCALVLNVGGKRSVATYIASGGLHDLETFDEVLWQMELLGQHNSGLGVLSMAHTALEAVALTVPVVEVVLRSLTKIFPIVIVDTTSIYNDIILTAIRLATRILLVSHYELTGLRTMMECVVALADPDNPLENRSSFILNNTRARPAIRPQDFEARVKLPIYGQLPFGEDVPSIAARDGTPVVELRPQSPLARELTQLADRLVGVPASAPSALLKH